MGTGIGMSAMKSKDGQKRGRKPVEGKKKSSLDIEKELQADTAGTSFAPAKAVVRLAKAYRNKHDYNIELGKRIVTLRLFLGFKRQADFAAALKVSRAAVGNWERGAGVSRRSMLDICHMFNASFEWLAGDIGEMIVGTNEKKFATTRRKMRLLKGEDFDAFQNDVDRLLDGRLARAGVVQER